MANVPKDNRSALAGSRALYYFPEIPCSMGKEPAVQSTHARFVGMGLGHHCDHPVANGDLEDSDQVRELIEEAFNKGMDQGRAETMAIQQESVDQVTAAFRHAVEETARIRKQDRGRVEMETVRLALAIAKKVIGHATEHGRVIENVVKAAMQKVADPRQLTLKLNPRDLDTVAGFQHELQNGEDSDALLKLEGDEAIGRGGCVIEARLGDVDARIDQQIKVIEELLNDQLFKTAVDG